MLSNSHNIEIMIYDKADEVIEEHFLLFFNGYQIELETSMKGSDFIFDCYNLLHYICHKINLNFGGSYTDSPDCIKHKKAKINSINYDGKCFQYIATGALNYNKIGQNPQRISKIKPFIETYN